MKLSDTDVERGASKAMTPIFLPSDATDRTATWTSSDTSVATIDSTGRVTGLKIGKTTITAVSHDGGFTAKCTVNVIVPIKEIDLSENSLTLKKGDVKSITATILPADTTESRIVEWSTSNPAIAAVDSTGKITAVEGGSATITAIAGNHTANCTVRVIVPLTGISLNPDSVRLPVNTDMTLSVIYDPVDATDTNVTWKSDNPEVATVDAGGKLHGVTTGSATITATSHDGGFTANCKVDVVIPVTKISLNQSSMTLKKGETSKLTATISPANATDPAVEWSTSAPDVATVDDSGNITAVEGGSAVITVKTHDGGYAAQCHVTVIVPVTGVTLSKTSLSIPTNGTAALTAIFQPADATDTGISWSSSAPDIISVDQNGIVKALTEIGAATITATTHDGEFMANCTVTISNTPSAPQKLTASMAGDTTVSISWSTPENDGHSPITGYKITVNGKDYTTTGNSYSITCPNDSTFSIAVSGINVNGDGTSITKKYRSATYTNSWSSLDTVYRWEKVGEHNELNPGGHLTPDGGWSTGESIVDDYDWVAHQEWVDHSRTYHTITEIA